MKKRPAQKEFFLVLNECAFMVAAKAKAVRELRLRASFWNLIYRPGSLSYERSKKIQIYLGCSWGRLFTAVRK